LLKPLRLAWDTKHTVTSFKAHRKVVSMLEMALKELAIRPWLWDTINDFGGCYAFRQVRGAKSLSRHSWGIAVDLDVLDNPFLGKIPRVNKDVRFIMKEHGFAWGGAAVWGGDFPWARRDAQHWEFADLSLLK
jgi:hypothetical protein